MKYILYIIAGSLIFFSCLSTKKTKVIELLYYGKNCIDEKVTRVYLNDSIFIEYTNVVFPPDEKNTRIDTFKVTGETWSIKRCGTFRLYFDPIGFDKGDTTLLYDRNCHVLLRDIPQGIVLEKNKILYKFKTDEQHYNYFAPISLFDPELGIVKIVAPTLECETRYLKLIRIESLKKKDLKELYLAIRPQEEKE